MKPLTPAEQPVWDAFVVALIRDVSKRLSIIDILDNADALIEARREREGKQEP